MNKEINTVEITDDLILGNAKPNLIDNRLWKKLNNVHIALMNNRTNWSSSNFSNSDEDLTIEQILSEEYINAPPTYSPLAATDTFKVPGELMYHSN